MRLFQYFPFEYLQADKIYRDGSIRKKPHAHIDNEVGAKKIKRKKKKSYKAPTHRSSDDETDRKISTIGNVTIHLNFVYTMNANCSEI